MGEHANSDDFGLITKSKDAVVFLPIALSALALSWEAGVFYPAGPETFGAFSIADHLAFAMSGLPLAMILSSGCGVILMLRANPASIIRPIVRPRRYFQFATIILSTLLSLPVAMNVWRSTPHLLMGFVSLVLVISLVILFLIADLNEHLVYRYGATLLLFLTFMGFAYDLGMVQTYATAERGRVSDIQTNEGRRVLRVILANSTGLLGTDPFDGRFYLIKGDGVRERSWQGRIVVGHQPRE